MVVIVGFHRLPIAHTSILMRIVHAAAIQLRLAQILQSVLIARYHIFIVGEDHLVHLLVRIGNALETG